MRPADKRAERASVVAVNSYCLASVNELLLIYLLPPVVLATSLVRSDVDYWRVSIGVIHDVIK